MSTLTLAMRYVSERRAKGEVNDRTAEQLRSRLHSFAKAAPDRPERVRRKHVERWMARPGLSAAYRRGRLSALKGFAQWCVLNGHMDHDPTAGVRAPRIPPAVPRALRQEEAVAVVAACPDTRTKAAALLMLQEGLRRAEVAAVQMGDIDLPRATVGVRGKGGQGKVTRVVPLSDETRRVIERYVAEEGGRTGPFLRSRVQPDRGISPQRVGELVTDAMRDAGVKHANGDGKSPHALRHTMAHHMVDEGGDILEVQEALGHASVQNSMIYLRGHVSPDLRRAMSGRSYLG